MAIKIFPTQNDISPVIGDGKTLTEANLAKWLKQLVDQNFVVNGLTAPASSATLNLTIDAGSALVSGFIIETDGPINASCTANATNHLYLALTKDVNGLVSGASVVVNTTGVAPADSVKLRTAVAGAASITSTTDARPLRTLGLLGGSDMATLDGALQKTDVVTGTVTIPASSFSPYITHGRGSQFVVVNIVLEASPYRLDSTSKVEFSNANQLRIQNIGTSTNPFRYIIR